MKRMAAAETLLAIIATGCGHTGADSPDAIAWRDDDGTRIRVELVEQADSLHTLRLTADDSLCSEWPLPYPVYRLTAGDITGDGVPEIGVGVVKGTRFFPDAERRLFLFHVADRRYIRPLWLGSRVSHPLVDFVIHSPVVRTIELDDDSTYLVAEYSQQGFGLRFDRYITRHTDEASSRKLLLK